MLGNLKELWRSDNILSKKFATRADIEAFGIKYELSLPSDLIDYFLSTNGTNSEYDSNFFKFYSLSDFLPVGKFYASWKGIPSYSEITESLFDHENVFILADYSIHVFAYGIRLYPKQVNLNEVYVISGGKFMQVSKTFSEFVGLYLNDLPALFM